MAVAAAMTTDGSKIDADTMVVQNSDASDLMVGILSEGIRGNVWATLARCFAAAAAVAVAAVDVAVVVDANDTHRSKKQCLLQFERRSSPQKLLSKHKQRRDLAFEPRKTEAVE